LNASPLGSAALGTSSFDVDRTRLAELLGFDGAIENSFGAIHVSPIDTGMELAGLVGSNAIIITNFLEYITAQYYDPDPWIVLSGAEGRSSIMPQKRNPTILVNLRTNASKVLGQAQTYSLLAHNVGAGMMDYKGSEPQESLESLGQLFSELALFATQLTINSERALAEVNADYSTTTELADVLQREGNVPFRIGHHFASELVTFGRSRGLGPLEIPYGQAQRIYAMAAEEYSLEDELLPLHEETLRRSLSPQNMVAESKGLGGPQPAEVARMIEARRARLDQDRVWIDNQESALRQASRLLDNRFEAIKGPR
jgi:argininosuccinate lyase